ncbi:hypothetical protein PHYBLDRAFT_69127 [Phycomyces blakesleeanus NRRL 1555(-)]|uniref:Uncharacterized protein n=1 Tax=Phycomyces blakesleeanus (strain ATCC 8743b / DSM 1359 / FGSC 10004 / NBRC 33097 / NRRL 1555) TaxID=763407 RepID=A0A162ZNI9_PHYB8|nr:hypothetical protein PHYBLDRAFT_69127 [Phycomyces blakesleeanus NRRL 1555(-)]OAD68051.1 hypothetical protein PHYBLDRAFT_69127 [Phycomyces blakesleeanus NRRL 1555(-)]|eukprot:XP_018286091.1 hypothetical protein PHYBLDRAFT_69127 [Phycomyces blakesleeanus NRRL 1555(-)]
MARFTRSLSFNRFFFSSIQNRWQRHVDIYSRTIKLPTDIPYLIELRFVGTKLALRRVNLRLCMRHYCYKIGPRAYDALNGSNNYQQLYGARKKRRRDLLTNLKSKVFTLTIKLDSSDRLGPNLVRFSHIQLQGHRFLLTTHSQCLRFKRTMTIIMALQVIKHKDQAMLNRKVKRLYDAIPNYEVKDGLKCILKLYPKCNANIQSIENNDLGSSAANLVGILSFDLPKHNKKTVIPVILDSLQTA